LFGRIIEQQVINLMPKFYENDAIDFTNVATVERADNAYRDPRPHQKKKAPTPLQSRGRVPRSSPRLPPVMAEGDMREHFFQRG
jgi:hypothetical protein